MSDSIVIEESNGEVTVIEPTVVINQTTCAAEWGGITGDIADQTDLMEELAKKMDVAPTVLASGTNPDDVKTNGKYALDNLAILIVATISGGVLLQIMYEYDTAPAIRFSSNDVWGGWDNYALSSTLSNKVDKVPGKGLSTNDYTTAEKTKLAGVEAGAQVNAANTVIDANYVHTDNNYTDDEKTKLSSAVTSSNIPTMQRFTQAEYDAAAPRDPNKAYFIVG